MTAIEFAIVANVFFMLFFGILFNGLNGVYQATLDDAVRSAARQMQMAGSASTSAPGFVTAVCTTFGVLAPDCASKLSYSVQSAPATAGFGSLSAAVLSSGGSFANTFFSGAARGGGVNLLVQVAYPLPFALPFSSYFTGTGLNCIKAQAVVRMEPF